MNLRIEKFRILTKYNCCFRLLKTQIQIQPSAIFKMNIWLLLTVEEMRPQVVYNIDRSSLSVSAIPRYEIVQIFFCKTFEEVTFRKSQTLTEKKLSFLNQKERFWQIQSPAKMENSRKVFFRSQRRTEPLSFGSIFFFFGRKNIIRVRICN